MLTLLVLNTNGGPATKATTQIQQEKTITHTKHYKSLYKLIKATTKLTHRLANKSNISLAFCLS